MDKIRNEYFLWLLKRIDVGYVNINNYDMLMAFLDDYDYIWTLDLDGNLASHGLDLRYEFSPDFDLGPKPCSVLEMMIALSWMWEVELTYDYQVGNRSGYWFWVMIENLGLLSSTDWNFDPDYVEEKLVIWLYREFDYNGVGSPFPLENANRDQRELITWLQVNDFVMENVEI